MEIKEAQINFQDVTSSNIKAIAFEDDTLWIKFNSDKIYSYSSNEDEFKKFTESESKGKFFNQNIKGRPYKEVTILEKLDD